MNTALILEILKANLGISTTVRDVYLTQLIASVVDELENEKGLKLIADSPNHLVFVADYAAHRYKKEPTMPRSLQYRLRNLIISRGGSNAKDVQP